ncbi:MAG: MlaD family protein [Actinomycetota bacterium]|nr:MlaD family protein [Actinomycetota bacterium]
MRGRGAASIVASPVLIGAVTTLIVIVAVFLAYNANQGLPFVPTYNLRAEVTGGQNLVKGNEVRVGGFRVGVVDQIGTGTKMIDGQPRSIAVLRMKLDKKVEPLPKDTTVLVRPRSALGLKYVELTVGKSKENYLAGDTIPLAQSKVAVEFDDLLNTFDFETRQAAQDATAGFGDAFAGRGADVNTAIQSLAPFFRFLGPVMANLSDPETELDEFFKQIGRAAGEVAPVAEVQARLFTEMADTFEAIGRNPDALRATIEGGPPTLDVAISSFRAQRPFLADFADLSRRLRPSARVLPTALPRLNAAFRVGTPIVRRSVILNEETTKVLEAVEDLVQDPNTLVGLKDLTTLVRSAGPLFTYLSPFQTVCNYGTYWWNGLGSHISEGTPNGTAQRVLVKTDNSESDNRQTDFGDRPDDLPANVDPTGAKNAAGDNLMVHHGQPYTPAIDAQGNANCVTGNWGYLDRYIGGPNGRSEGRYPPVNGSPDPGTGNFDTWEGDHGGGSHVVVENDSPFLYGPTFTGRKHLKDVP